MTNLEIIKAAIAELQDVARELQRFMRLDLRDHSFDEDCDSITLTIKRRL